MTQFFESSRSTLECTCEFFLNFFLAEFFFFNTKKRFASIPVVCLMQNYFRWLHTSFNVDI